MNCSVCGKPLTGGLDTYGDVGSEVCWEDYFDPPTDDLLIVAERDDLIAGLREDIADLDDELNTLDPDDPEDEAYACSVQDDLNWKSDLLAEQVRQRKRSQQMTADANRKRLEAWRELVFP